jgi:H-NS histone family protein
VLEATSSLDLFLANVEAERPPPPPSLCKFVRHRDGGTVRAALKRADVCSVHTGLVGERFLRQALLLPVLPQVASKHLSHIHMREASALMCISPWRENTWTGRGSMPRWMAAATKGGKATKDDFLI